jgi:hypothetical protein
MRYPSAAAPKLERNILGVDDPGFQSDPCESFRQFHRQRSRQAFDNPLVGAVRATSGEVLDSPNRRRDSPAARDLSHAPVAARQKAPDHPLRALEIHVDAAR